jgi:rubrerythrin
MPNPIIALLDPVEKLINEHGSSVILKKRLEFARDQYEALERQVGELQKKTGRLELALEQETTKRAKAELELGQLQREHEEEIRILGCIEFRRGKRTGNKWIPFCPKCHGPVARGFYRGSTKPSAYCPSCNWRVLIEETFENMVTKLD